MPIAPIHPARKFVNAVRLLALFTLCGVCELSFASPTPHSVYYRYNLAGDITGKIFPDPDGSGPLKHGAVRYTYDSAGQLTNEERGELSTWQSESVAPASWSGFTVKREITYQYDAYGRPSRETLVVDGTTEAVIQSSYDTNSRLQCTAVRMNPASFGSLPTSACTAAAVGSFGHDRIMKINYDGNSRVLSIQKGVGTALAQTYASYTYTPNHQPKTVTDAKGNRTEYAYDGHSRRVRTNYPSKTNPGTTNFSDYSEFGYDANGNVTSIRHRNGTTINFVHDALNQVKLKDLPGTTDDVYYMYNNIGLLTYARFSSTSGQGITYTYDDFNRLKTAATNMGGLSRQLSYEYDANGNRTRITHPDSSFFAYEYDDANRVINIREGASTIIASFQYDSEGRRKSLTRPSAIQTDYEYDTSSRLSALDHDLAGTGDDISFDFNRNPSGQITKTTVSDIDYVFDELVAGTKSFSPNGLNQYVSADGASLTYWPSGTLKSDGNQTYYYDSENRLTSVTGGSTVDLQYDPLGRLYRVDNDGIVTFFVYDGLNLALEYTNSGSVNQRYVRGPWQDEVVTQYAGSSVSTTSRVHLIHDSSGSAIASTNSTGSAISLNTYDSYGVGGTLNSGRIGFTGQVSVPGTDLWYFKGRFLNSKLGRYIQPDPMGYADTLNLYLYVGGDPLNRTDPSGLCPEDSQSRASQPICIQNPAMHPEGTGVFAIIAWHYFNAEMGTLNDSQMLALGLAPPVVKQLDGSVGVTRNNFHLWSPRYNGNQYSVVLFRTNAAVIAKKIPYAGLAATLYAEGQKDLSQAEPEKVGRSAINVGGALIGLVPSGQIPAVAVLVTNAAVDEDTFIPANINQQRDADIVRTTPFIRSTSTENPFNFIRDERN